MDWGTTHSDTVFGDFGSLTSRILRVSSLILTNNVLLSSLTKVTRAPSKGPSNVPKFSLFGKRVAHGMLTASLLSGVIAAQLPGLGTIYLGLNVKFTKPVFFGDTVTARVEVKEINSEKEIVTLACQCTNQDGKTVLKGEATVLAPPREK